MLNKLKNLDPFAKNICIVFLSSSILNFLNLIYQLLIAHRLTAADFAAFNSLLSIYMLVSSPLVTLQVAVAKYSSEFNARGEPLKIKTLLSRLLKFTGIMACVTFFIFLIGSKLLLTGLKIYSPYSGFFLAVMLFFAWVLPVLSGGIQGLELFGWLAASSVIGGIAKLGAAFILLALGFKIAGALFAFVISIAAGIIVIYIPLNKYISFKTAQERIDFREILRYLLPVAISAFCFIALVSFDMVLVKYFFSPEESGLYSLGQMVGKIFLFLPAAIGLVMFPRTCGLNASKLDAAPTLKRSLLYAGILCAVAAAVYNLFPAYILKVLTGKAYPESIILGRLFSISMSFFTLSLIIGTYFLSLKDLRFIKYLVLFTAGQILAVGLFHRSLSQVQLILCVNSCLVFCLLFALTKRPAVLKTKEVME